MRAGATSPAWTCWPASPRWSGEAGWRTVNVDATVIAERPRLAPHVPAMPTHVAAGLGLAEGAVGVKVTTNERLGALGREEGIAALAVALLMRE
jgi:2-C-methyl-D-erythritol 2,4-cyclodiphosphate synthase